MMELYKLLFTPSASSAVVYLQLRETLGGPCINYLKKGQSRQAPTLVGCICWTTVGALIVVDVGGVLPLQQH